MPEEERSYVIVRHDGLILHTKPITFDEAWWLYLYAYSAEFIGRGARIRYLEEWGNVMDAGDSVDYLRQQLEQLGYGPYHIGSIYRDLEGFIEKVGRLLRLRRLPPEVRQLVKELADEVRDFLKKPVEPRPIEAPVRYLELSRRHVRLGPDGAVREVEPRPEWHAYEEPCRSSDLCHGVSVFGDSFWLWRQKMYGVGFVQVVVVRRDVDDKEVVAALANDNDVQEFLRRNADAFRELLRESEEEMVSRGYGDVARKARLVLATYELLTAGRREEEALPA